MAESRMQAGLRGRVVWKALELGFERERREQVPHPEGVEQPEAIAAHHTERA